MESIVDSKDKLHFFEYLEVDLLQDYFRQGILHLVNALLNAHPKLIPLRYWTPEITAIIDFIKDFLALKSYRATYAQNFFGLERGELGKWGALKGALVWAILPYIASRIDSFYNEIVGQQLDGARLGVFKKMVKQVYPYLYALFGLLQIFYKFRYLYFQNAKDPYYHLLYKLQKLHLKRLPQQQEQKYPILQLLKKPGLLMVLMGHKVFTWYFSQQKQKRTGKIEKQEIVASPLQESKVQEGGRCSICTNQIKNPTVVRPTGYVYCWQCISAYVRKEGRCPLSGLKMEPQNLQILYE